MGKIAKKFNKAIIENEFAIVEQLLNEHPDKIHLNKADKYGHSYLSKAIVRCCPKTVELLLKKGANPNFIPSNNSNPLSNAIGYGYIGDRPNKIKLLLDYQIERDLFKNALHHAAACYNSEVVKLLIDYGWKIDLQDEGGNTPLIVASLNPYGEESAIHLIEAGANLSVTNQLGINFSLGIVGYAKKRVLELLGAKKYNVDLEKLLTQPLILEKQISNEFKDKLTGKFFSLDLVFCRLVTFFSLPQQEQIVVLPKLNHKYKFNCDGDISITDRALLVLTSRYQRQLNGLFRQIDLLDKDIEDRLHLLDYAAIQIYNWIKDKWVKAQQDSLENLWNDDL